MNIKLINKQTNEEHICSKVVIDGFDYYVNNNGAEIGDTVNFFNGSNYISKVIDKIGNSDRDIILEHMPESRKNGTLDYREMKKVIATNNPSIDLPKVVDEVEILSQLEFPVSTSKGKWGFEDAVQGFNKRAFTKGYYKSQKSHPFSEEDMIEFAKWIINKDWKATSLSDEGATTKELLQIWKEQRIKTVYYG